MSLHNSAKMPPGTVFENALDKQHECEDRIPKEAANDRISSNQKHDEGRILLNIQEAEDHEKDRILSNENEGEHQNAPYDKRRRNRRETLHKPYARGRAFDGTDKVALFNKNSCKVAITIWVSSSRMCPVNSVFATGAALNLLRRDIVEHKLMSSIRVCKRPRVRNMTNQKVEVVGAIMLHVCMREPLVRVMLGIVKNLAVSVFFETCYRFVKRIFRNERKLVTYSLQSIPIVMVQEASDDN